MRIEDGESIYLIEYKSYFRDSGFKRFSMTFVKIPVGTGGAATFRAYDRGGIMIA